MYFPIAVDGALVRAWEMTLRSPAAGPPRPIPSHLFQSNRRAARQHHRRLHLQHSHRPGLRPRPQLHRRSTTTSATPSTPASRPTCRCTPGSPPTSTTAPASPTASPAPTAGPYNGPYLPVHTTFDVSAGHTIGERWKLSATVLNVTNHRVLLDNSVTIGGFHCNDPRMISAELRYRFHF